MKDIISRLIQVETLAGDFYRAAAESFRNEERLSAFLGTLATDEDWHKELMEKASECRGNAEFDSQVTFDEEIVSKLERLFIEGREKIAKRVFTRDELFDCIIETEFSEWNPIFLYAVNTVNKDVEECFDIAPRVQLHEKYISRFIETSPDFLRHLERLRGLPRVWRDKVLIVDDDSVILMLLRDVFEEKWSVETTSSGEEALEKMRYSAFDVVISDIVMRPMDGIALYSEAKKVWPGFGGKFLFLSGNVAKHEEFFRENNLRYLLKPFSIAELKKAALDIAHREVDTRLAGVLGKQQP